MNKLKTLILVAMLGITPLVFADKSTELHLSDSNLSLSTKICNILQGNMEDFDFKYSTKIDKTTKDDIKTSTISNVCLTQNLLINFYFNKTAKNSIGELAMLAKGADFKEVLPVLFIINTEEELQRDEAIIIAGAKKYRIAYTIIATDIDNPNLYSDVQNARSIILNNAQANGKEASTLENATSQLQQAENDLNSVYDRLQQGLVAQSEYDAVLAYKESKQAEYDLALNKHNTETPSASPMPIHGTQGADATVVAQDATVKFISYQQNIHNKALANHEKLHNDYYGNNYRADFKLLKDIDSRIDSAHRAMEAKQREYTAAAEGSQEKIDAAHERNILWRKRDNLKQQKVNALARVNSGKNQHKAARDNLQLTRSAVSNAENAYAIAWFQHMMAFGADKEAKRVIMQDASNALVAAQASRDQAVELLGHFDNIVQALKASRQEMINSHPAKIDYDKYKVSIENYKLIVDYSRNLNLAWQGCSYLNACYSVSAFSKINWSVTGSLAQAKEAIHRYNYEKQKFDIAKDLWDEARVLLLKDLPNL